MQARSKSGSARTSHAQVSDVRPTLRTWQNRPPGIHPFSLRVGAARLGRSDGGEREIGLADSPDGYEDFAARRLMGLFQSRKSFNPLTDLPDLSGKVIIVTGGNAGIGYSTVKHIARKGAKVYIAGRNKARVEEAIAKLKQEGLEPGNGEVLWLELDLIDPRNAKKAAQEFMSKEKRLDVLIHNAALLIEQYELTPDGVNRVFLVNVISPFVLTRELMPVLNQTAAEPNSDVRVVMVGPEGHKFVPGKPRFRTLEDLNNEYKRAYLSGFTRYTYSKLGSILYASELQRKLSAEGSRIIVITLDPGAVNTFSRKPQLRSISWLVDALVYPFFVCPDVGAYTSVFAAASSDVAEDPEKYKGAYLLPVGIIRQPNETGSSEELAKELWGTIETFLADKDI